MVYPGTERFQGRSVFQPRTVQEASMSFRTKVCVLGTGGQTKFGHHPGTSLESLITTAAREAIQSAGVEARDIGAGFVGDCASALFARQSLTSSLLAETAPELHT